MLLNIVDFDPRAKKRAAENAKDDAPANANFNVLEVKQKRKLQQPTSVQLATSKRSKLDKSTLGKVAGKGRADVSSAAAADNVAAAVGGRVAGNLTLKSAPSDVELKQQRRQQQKPQQHRQKNLSSAGDADGPDWSSVADSLLGEIADVEKLFQEQLDMDTPTANSEKVFSKLAIKDCKDIHPYLVAMLTEKMGLKYFTNVQADTLPLVLAGKDVLIKTQTGSGKSLALLLPLVQTLQAVEPPLTRSSGVQALVLCPTHELAEQSHQLLEQLLRPFVRIVSGQLVGGVKRKSQKASLRRGLNILVATPRRLLDHLEKSSRLDLGSSLRLLIVDEADRLSEMGYERDVRQIVEAVCANGRRPQTLLCSATLNDGAERLAGLALNEPSSVSEDDAVPASVRHYVLAAPTRMRLRALLSVIRPLVAAGQKAALFLPTQASVDFHHALLSTLLSDSVPLCRLHGNLAHADRMRSFRKFAACTGSGLLVTTDVSARGLDLSYLTWVIQGPGEPEIYCHRAGRTARLGRPGRCLLLLDEAELAPYLRLLSSSAPSQGIKFAPVPCAQLVDRCCPENFGQLSGMVSESEELKSLAEDAFVSTLRARASVSGDLKAALAMPHLGHLASSFCLSDAPGVVAANARRRRHGDASEDVSGGGGGGGGTGKRTSKVTAGRRVRTGGAGGGDRMSEFASGI